MCHIKMIHLSRPSLIMGIIQVLEALSSEKLSNVLLVLWAIVKTERYEVVELITR